MSDNQHKDIIDKDLYEDLDEDEMRELIEEERARKKQEELEEEKKPKRPFPKWVFWLIAFLLFFNIAAALPSIFSLPAIDFIRTSAELMLDEDVQEYRESIVTVDTGVSTGTGFIISEDGYMLTNQHVIDDREQLWIYLADEGPVDATIVEEYPEIDLALLQIEGDGHPYLELAEETSYLPQEPFYFIGSPLGFSGIANQGEIIGEASSSSVEGSVLLLDAPIYRGNSGSPVINQDGEVIAVIYATRQDEEHGRIGLSIPIDSYYLKSENE
ncbi:S1C family serine protease [Halalkalibacillus halophilus]|uniref:S1C family serine protease n=1 Tax=Halalkalibacillus halophilus TaxID=392827 RepID=UPI000A049A5C|nr:serine protease [Halalkalibacillus halophilus]